MWSENCIEIYTWCRKTSYQNRKSVIFNEKCGCRPRSILVVVVLFTPWEVDVCPTESNKNLPVVLRQKKGENLAFCLRLREEGGERREGGGQRRMQLPCRHFFGCCGTRGIHLRCPPSLWCFFLFAWEDGVGKAGVFFLCFFIVPYLRRVVGIWT